MKILTTEVQKENHTDIIDTNCIKLSTDMDKEILDTNMYLIAELQLPPDLMVIAVAIITIKAAILMSTKQRDLPRQSTYYWFCE